MSEKIIFQLEDLHKFYGQREILKGISISFFEGAKIGLIGLNGSGKTTLLRIIAGEDKQFEGVARPTSGLSIGYLQQEPPLSEDKTVAENIDEAVSHLREIEARYYEVTNLLGEAEGAEADKLNEEFAHLSEEMDHKEIWELDSRLEQAAHALQVPPMDAGVAKLSGGERRRVALCKLLLEHPDMLLLDEPTNHLDSESIGWLETHLAQYQGTVILITHDRYFLDNVVGWMLEIERGVGKPYEGNYTQYLVQKARMLDLKRRQDVAREKVLQRELEWIQKTPAARQKQSKARLKRYQDLAQERVEDQLDSLELRIPPGPRLGDKVVEGRGLKKGYGERVLFEDLTFEVPPQAKLGVIGANGVGKTTLMRLIMGKEEPDAGEVVIGSTVLMSYLDQSRMILDDDKSVFANITDGNEQLPFGTKTIDSRAYVARFNFKGEDQQRLLGECSGGMRNRVLLAKMLRDPANLIIMDEPTNDLDLETLRVLEEAIEVYPGSMILVTHDRYFLNRVATHILSFEGDGVVHFHHGDYESFKEWKLTQGVDLESRAGTHRKFSMSEPRELAPLRELAFARSTVEAYVPRDAAQEATRRSILEFIDAHPEDAHERTCVTGHLTASALLVDSGRERVFLTLHRKLDKWLQFGGHCDGDANLRGVAWRETVEESGIEPAHISPDPIDLDIHPIPGRPGEPEHLHLDVRFLAVAPPGSVPTVSAESHDVGVFHASEVSRLGVDESVSRLLTVAGLT